MSRGLFKPASSANLNARKKDPVLQRDLRRQKDLEIREALEWGKTNDEMSRIIEDIRRDLVAPKTPTSVFFFGLILSSIMSLVLKVMNSIVSKITGYESDHQ